MRLGYESSGDPCGRLTNRFHIGGQGGLDRIGAAYSSDPITRWQTHDILLCEGEFTHENFTVPEGTSLAPTPHNLIKNS